MTHVIMAEAYYDMGEYAKSKKEIQTAYVMAPEDIGVLVSYGSLLLFDKKVDEARNIFEKVIQKDANNYLAYNNLAVIYSLKRDIVTTQRNVRRKPRIGV